MNEKTLNGLLEARQNQMRRVLIDYLNALALLGKTEREMADELELILKSIGHPWQIVFAL